MLVSMDKDIELFSLVEQQLLQLMRSSDMPFESSPAESCVLPQLKVLRRTCTKGRSRRQLSPFKGYCTM